MENSIRMLLYKKCRRECRMQIFGVPVPLKLSMTLELSGAISITYFDM